MTCPPRNSLIDPGRSLLSKVAIFDGIKPMGLKEFAQRNNLSEAEAQSRYAATGIFVCDDAAGNGQVVTKGNTVVTVFHTLLKDTNSCDKPRKVRNCAFIFQEDGKTHTINAKKIIAHGSCKPGDPKQTGNDWAIVELDKAVPKTIVPYKVPDAPTYQLLPA